MLAGVNITSENVTTTGRIERDLRPSIRGRLVKDEPTANEGFLTCLELMQLYTDFMTDPKKVSIAQLATKYRLNEDVVKSLLQHAALPIVIRDPDQDVRGEYRLAQGEKGELLGSHFIETHMKSVYNLERPTDANFEKWNSVLNPPPHDKQS
jgi:hypothetical protein